MGVLQVETVDVDVSSNGSTHTLTNDVGDINSAFFRNTTMRRGSAGPVGSTSNAGPDDVSVGPRLTNTNTLTVAKSNSVNQKLIGEVWRYSGAAAGVDEFVVRGRFQVSVNSSSSNSVAVPGIVNRNKCIPFITGVVSNETSQNTFDRFMCHAHIDASDNLVITRNNSESTTLTAYVTVVEFVGSNWNVLHCEATFSTQNAQITEDSTGSGAAGSVGDWSNALIADFNISGSVSNNVALEDTTFTLEPGSTPSTIAILKDTTAASDGTIMAHILTNPNMVIARETTSKTISNNNSYVTETFPNITLSNVNEACVEWSVFTDGTGTAYARGGLGAYLQNASTLRSWVHRSGNTGTYRYGVADFSSVDGTVKPIVSSAAALPEAIAADYVITGSNFGAIQGTGKVEFASSSDYATAIKVNQSIDTWSDTSIQIDANLAGLSEGTVYIFITDDLGVRSPAFGVNFGATPYSEVIRFELSNTPDHYWTFDDTLTEVIAGLNGYIRAGSPGFTADPLTRGSSNSLLIDVSNQTIATPDSSFMNLQTEEIRMMGGWIKLSQIQKYMASIYEEGGSVNNLAFFLGIGNIVVAQLADTSDDNVHAYSDVRLDPNRAYHILMTFDYTDASPRFKLFLDGVEQSVSFGNPLTSAHLDAHSGDISWGRSESNLEVFGTDISFPAAIDMNLSDWASWTSILPDSEIREKLFELGAIEDFSIASDTQANMQAALDAIANTTRPNSPLCIKIGGSTDGNFTLNADNITFDERASIHIQYIGTATLTWINNNGSNASIVSTPYGGTVNIINPAAVTLTGLQPGSNIRAYVGTNQLTSTLIASQDNNITGSFSFTQQQSGNDGYIMVTNLFYENLRIDITYPAQDQTIPVQQFLDRQFSNN